MLNSVSIGKFYNIKSPIHKMNPTSKIICVLIFIIAVLLSGTFQILGILAGLLIYVILISLLPIGLFIKQIYSLRYVIIAIAMVYYIKGYEVNAFLMILTKLILIVTYSAILTLTTKRMEIITGLEEFFSPLTMLKLPVSKMAIATALALNFIPTVIEQGHHILKAMAARGIDYYNSGYDTKIKAINTMFKPMLTLTFRRQKQIKTAMQVRLYGLHKKRTNYNAREWSLTDGVMITLHIGVFAYMTLARMGLI